MFVPHWHFVLPSIILFHYQRFKFVKEVYVNSPSSLLAMHAKLAFPKPSVFVCTNNGGGSGMEQQHMLRCAWRAPSHVVSTCGISQRRSEFKIVVRAGCDDAVVIVFLFHPYAALLWHCWLTGKTLARCTCAIVQRTGRDEESGTLLRNQLRFCKTYTVLVFCPMCKGIYM